jgi:hypothetical protein
MADALKNSFQNGIEGDDQAVDQSPSGPGSGSDGVSAASVTTDVAADPADQGEFAASINTTDQWTDALAHLSNDGARVDAAIEASATPDTDHLGPMASEAPAVPLLDAGGDLVKALLASSQGDGDGSVGVHDGAYDGNAAIVAGDMTHITPEMEHTLDLLTHSVNLFDIPAIDHVLADHTGTG